MPAESTEGTDATTHPAVEAEMRLLDPAVRGSAESLRALLHPDFVEFGSSGRRWDRDAIVAALTADPSAGVRVEDLEPVSVAPGVVHLRYTAVGPDRRTRRSTIWREDEGGWRAWFHQGTVVEGTGRG